MSSNKKVAGIGTSLNKVFSKFSNNVIIKTITGFVKKSV